MKLLTKELEKRFAEVGKQEEAEDPIVIAKFFNPAGAGTWFATELWRTYRSFGTDEEYFVNEQDVAELLKDKEEDYILESTSFYGYVSLFGDWNDEWGSFSLEELTSLVLPFGLGIERDLYFNETFSSVVIKQYTNY